ncbi:MAG: hypothetical protein NW237_08500 [Cyanobacteriota bacterium]|nr:hypothetical protein [Cyanobacteriota bacterium]
MAPLDARLLEGGLDLHFQLPDPTDSEIPEFDFQQQVEVAWQVCDRFDLQTDIWRGRILRVVRDHLKLTGDGRGSSFMSWLKERDISKSQAYALIELADSADILLQNQDLDSEAVERFSKRAFVETAQAAPEVQQMVAAAAQQGNRITRQEVRDLTHQWTAMTSDLIPPLVKAKVADNTIPTRYLAPLVKELAKLPPSQQQSLQVEIASHPDVDTLKQVTADARYLARYLEAAAQVRSLDDPTLNLEQALEEALRLGSLNLTADLMNQAAQLEQTLTRLYTTWKRLNTLSEKLYLTSGASTPHLQRLLNCLGRLSESHITLDLGQADHLQTIRLTLEELNSASQSSRGSLP